MYYSRRGIGPDRGICNNFCMSEPDMPDEDARMRMASEVMELLDHWQVSAQDRITLLGLPATVRKRSLQKYREDLPLPDDEEVIIRARHLLGISDALRTYFPNSPQARIRWMRTTHRKFPRISPIQIMVRDGISGLIRIRAHLDCTYAWDISGSQG